MTGTMQSTEQSASRKEDAASTAALAEQPPPRFNIKLGPHGGLATIVAFSTGLALGASHGTTRAALRFRAENAHRFPTDSAGWYQYHKSKNYVSMIGGLKDGMKLGTKLSVGVAGFCLLEEVINQARPGNRDFLSTVTAGLTFSGLYSLIGVYFCNKTCVGSKADTRGLIARHDVYTAARTAKLGLKLSLAYGLAQDVLSSAKGEKPGYIAWISKKITGDSGKST